MYEIILYDTEDGRRQIMNGGIVMSSYKIYKKRALQNPEVKAEYDALQPEYDIIQAMIDARVQHENHTFYYPILNEMLLSTVYSVQE